VLGRRLGLCAATAALLWLAVLLPIVGFDTIGDALDQIATYAVREKARTEIGRAPRLSLGDLVGRVSPTRAAISVAVRWSPAIDAADRLEAESRYGLHALGDGDTPDEKTRHYTMSDPSPAVVAALVSDPRVDDTAGLDRASQSSPPEPLWVRAQLLLPFLQWRVFPDAWTASNATAFIYYVLWGLPFAGVIGAASAWRSPWLTTHEAARLGTVVIVCVALNMIVLRDPVGARIGGIAGPAAILAAWIGARTWRTGRLALRVGLLGALLAVLALAGVSMASLMSWSERLVPQIASPSHMRSVISLVSASPPMPEIMSSPALAGMVQYLRECTSPKDRVLARWFVPELYFFAQRGFAAGMVTTFGGHWSESRFETRSVKALASESVPIVIARERDDELARDYPVLNRYIDEHYEVAGRTNFETPDSDGYVVLVRNDRTPARTHPPTGFPCFD
jgi:hypothetical protein